MIATQPRRTSLSSVVAAALLVIFSASGLMVGGMTFKLTGGLSLGGHEPAPTQQAHLPTTSLTPTATPSPVATAASTQPFTLTLEVTPRTPHPSDQLQAILTAVDTATHAPVAGLRSALEDPEDGGIPLLSTWPAPAVTNAFGQATWAINLPTMAPGTYAIGFTATGASGYRYHGQISIAVTNVS